MAAKESRDEVTVKVAKLPKEALPPKDPPVANEATPAAPPTGPARLAPPPVPPQPVPGSIKAAGGAARVGAPSNTAAKQGAAKLAAAFADKPPAAKPQADKSVPVDKSAGVDKLAAAPIVDKAAAGAVRAAPPERRRALEDSVVTSAPKLPGTAAARPPAKAVAKAAPAHLAASGKDRTGAEKVVPAPADPSGVPALRPRRDHNKSPGFYSSVSPAHAVTGGPFGPAPVQPKQPAAVGLVPAADPAPLRVPSLAHIPAADPALAQPPADEAKQATAPSPLAASVAEAGKVEIEELEQTEAVGEWASMVADDSFAPAQPCSSPPASVSPVAREEKEETSPGLGTARSPHDPNLASQVSGTDLELLLAFALDLALGCASEAWFVPLRAAVGRLLAGDAAIRSPALEKALTTLANDLEQAGAFREENRQRLYGHVVAVDLALSKRMDVTGQKAIRERLIVDQLLEELAQAHPLLPRRLKDQGLISLESLGRLNPTDLSARLEATPDTAAQVASIFQSYLDGRMRRGPTVALLGKSVAVKERLSALEASADAFERASEEEDSGARRRTRKQRQTDVTQLNLLLAEFGEAKTLAEIERCSVQAKIERLQRWIGEQETSSGRRPPNPSSPP